MADLLRDWAVTVVAVGRERDEAVRLAQAATEAGMVRRSAGRWPRASRSRGR
ncbi:MAG: hypothetical protein ABIL09_24030 [Gemmatimonadota bacterium]